MVWGGGGCSYDLAPPLFNTLRGRRELNANHVGIKRNVEHSLKLYFLWAQFIYKCVSFSLIMGFKHFKA